MVNLKRYLSNIELGNPDQTNCFTFVKSQDSGDAEGGRKRQVYECLKHWIIYGALPPGTPLNERELSEKFGISRTPMREVLQRLGYQQLVVIEPRKGIRVADIDYLNLESIFEVRVPVEAKAASLAAQRADDRDIQALQAVVDLSREAHARGDILRVIQLDQIFHEMMGDVSGNPVLRKVLEDLHNACLRFWCATKETLQDKYEGVEDLAAIVGAIRNRDPELAARLNARHVMDFLDLI